MFSNKLSDQSEFKRQYLYLRHVPLPSFLSKTEYILNSKFLFFLYWTPCGSWKVPMKYGQSVLLSIILSVQAFSSLVFASLVFFFGIVLETHMKLCMTVLNFPKKNFFAPKMVQKLKFIEKCKKLKNIENSSCTNPIFGDSLVHEIWAKMFSANKIEGFFNQPDLRSKSMK